MPRVSKNNDYLPNGVKISPAIPSPGDRVKLVYDGLLSKSGANDIYAHFGYNSNWDNLSYLRMNRALTGFESTITLAEANTLNLAFKDCANNWDNNSGKNYVFDVAK